MIYLVPGLEMDSRIISRVLFRGETEYETIQLIKPEKNENIQSYAKRLSSQVKHEDVTFVGFSFGGIIAVELATLCSYKKVVIISAPRHSSQIPFWQRILGYSKIIKLIPNSVFTDSVVIRNFLMGMKTKDRDNLKKIHSELPHGLIRWGIERALLWKFNDWPEEIYQIHATNDRIYKPSLIKQSKNVTMVKDGGHLMFAYKPKAVSQALKMHLEKE